MAVSSTIQPLRRGQTTQAWSSCAMAFTWMCSPSCGLRYPMTATSSVTGRPIIRCAPASGTTTSPWRPGGRRSNSVSMPSATRPRTVAASSRPLRKSRGVCSGSWRLWPRARRPLPAPGTLGVYRGRQSLCHGPLLRPAGQYGYGAPPLCRPCGAHIVQTGQHQDFYQPGRKRLHRSRHTVPLPAQRTRLGGHRGRAMAGVGGLTDP